MARDHDFSWVAAPKSGVRSNLVHLRDEFNGHLRPLLMDTNGGHLAVIIGIKLFLDSGAIMGKVIDFVFVVQEGILVLHLLFDPGRGDGVRIWFHGLGKQLRVSRVTFVCQSCLGHT